MQVGMNVRHIWSNDICQIVPTPDRYHYERWANEKHIVWIENCKSGNIGWVYEWELKIISPPEDLKTLNISKPTKSKVSVNTINFRRLVAIDIIKKQNGKFFTIIFTGKDGKEHSCNGRAGVIKHLKGVGRTIKSHDDLLTIFNVHKMSYRNIFLDGIREIRAEGKIFTFD